MSESRVYATYEDRTEGLVFEGSKSDCRKFVEQNVDDGVKYSIEPGADFYYEQALRRYDNGTDDYDY